MTEPFLLKRWRPDVGKSKLETAQADYQALSESFTELNKEYNRATLTDTMTDDLELRFLKAERELRAAYSAQQDAKMGDDS